MRWLSIAVLAAMVCACERDTRTPRLLLQSTPAVQLVTRAEDPVGSVSDIQVWGDRVVIVDDMLKNVKVFDWTGALRTTLGRPGSGPGEFRGPVAAVVLPTGELAVLDAARLRIVVFDTAGNNTREIPIEAIRLGGLGLRDGEFLVAGRIPSANADTTAASAIHRFNAEGELLGSYGRQWTPRTINEGSFNTIHSAIVGNVAVLVPMSTNEVQLIDLATHDTATRAIGSDFYVSPAWPEKRMSGPREAIQWAQNQQWVQGVLPIDSNSFLLKLVVWGKGDNPRYSYVLADTHGRTEAGSAPTDADVWGGSAGLFSVQTDDAGRTLLRRVTLTIDSQAR